MRQLQLQLAAVVGHQTGCLQLAVKRVYLFLRVGTAAFGLSFGEGIPKRDFFGRRRRNECVGDPVVEFARGFVRAFALLTFFLCGEKDFCEPTSRTNGWAAGGGEPLEIKIKMKRKKKDEAETLT